MANVMSSNIAEAHRANLQKVQEAVALVHSEEGSGAGFFIRPGLMVTAAHILPSREVAARSSVSFFDNSSTKPLFSLPLNPRDFFFSSPPPSSFSDQSYDRYALNFTCVSLSMAHFSRKIASRDKQVREAAIRIYKTCLVPGPLKSFDKPNPHLRELYRATCKIRNKSLFSIRSEKIKKR